MTCRLERPFLFITSLLVVLFTIMDPEFCEAGTYTVEQVAKALATTEAQFTDEKIAFTYVYADINPDHKVTEINRLEGIYGRRSPGPQELLDCKCWSRSAEGAMPSPPKDTPDTSSLLLPESISSTFKLLTRDALVAYNGRESISIDRIPDRNGWLHAVIAPGYQEHTFAHRIISPSDLVWRWLRNAPYSQLIVPPTGQFVIESNDEIVNGYHTIRLSGRIGSGSIRMKLWVAPDNGFVPIRMEQTDSEYPRLEDFRDLSHLVKLAPNRWFPRLIVTWNPSYPANGKPSFMAIRSISIDPLSQGFFNPSIPNYTLVDDEVRGLQYQVRVHHSSTQPATRQTEMDLQNFFQKAQTDSQ